MKKNIFILDDDYIFYKKVKKVLKFYFPESTIYPSDEEYEEIIYNIESRNYECLFLKVKELNIEYYIIDIKFGNDNNPSGIEFLEYLEKELPFSENKYDYILITDGGYERNNLKKYSENIPFISKSNLGNRLAALSVKKELEKFIN